MKILFFIESLHSGGKERRLVELLKGLKKNFREINFELVLTKKKIHYKEVLKLGIKIHILERKFLKKDPLLFFQFYRLCKKYQPDIMHTWGNMVTIYSIPAKLLLKIPLINNQIIDAPKNVKGGIFSYKINFLFSNIIISNSQAGLDSYKAPKTKSIVIHNGFDFKRIEKLEPSTEVRKKLHINTKYLIGMVASFSEKKDYATYIQAANIILETNNNVTFFCIGSGDKSIYKKLVDPKFKYRVKFFGCLQKVESIMNICDIGVLTTNQELHGEGISNSLMEFMALGKPVICTDGGGSKELILDNKTGYLISPHNPNELPEKIKYILDNPNKAKIMGNMGKERIKNEFGIEKMVKSFYKIYQNIYAE